MRNIKWIALLLGFPFILCSCENASTQATLERKNAQIGELEQIVADLERKHADALENRFSALTDEYNRHVDVLRKEFEARSERLELTAANLQERIKTKDNEIAKLKSAVERARNDAREWEERYLTEKEGKGASNLKAPILDPEEKAQSLNPQEDLFPLRVFDVMGEKVVIGRHMVSEYVDTDETYRDAFGNVKPIRKRLEVPREEYGYRVSFSIHNPTQQSRDVSVRAGTLTRVISLEPGATVSNHNVSAAMGAPLTVMAGGYSKNFDVTYEEPAK